ncbi:MAG TPA: hypothetical protein QF889_01315, partial [Flavobacteriaceae bacterium]|nr:hypothetical protein [Flavobacteriaceae bacterium]
PKLTDNLKNKIIEGTKIQSKKKSIKNLTNVRDNFLIDLQKGDKIINLTSMPIDKKGMTNTLRISEI